VIIRRALTVYLFCAACIGTATVHAQGDELPDRFALNLGGYHLWDTDTEFSARRGAILGTSINFERDLDGQRPDTAARVSGYYRFNPHHRIDFGWYRVDREGGRTLSRELRFGDVTFPIELGITAGIDTEILKLAYSWSFHHTDQVELALSVGLNHTSYDFSIRNPRRTLAESKSLQEPLPVLGFRMDYRINPRWHVLLNIDSFYVALTDDLRGSLDDLQIALEYRPFRNVSFGIGATRLALDVRVEESDFRGSVTDLLRGGQLYLGLRF
jgi:hypothetical protein